MINLIGAAIGSACVALGMRFEKPPIILEHENTPLEDIMHCAAHRQSLELQELFGKTLSPYETLLKGGVFPENAGQVINKRWYIRHKETGLYLGSCHTTGDGIWTDKQHAESWRTKELAQHDGMAYHPFQRLKDSVVDIVLE